MVIRPSATGALVMNQLNTGDAPTTLAYEVGLEPQQSLIELDNGAVAIVEPPPEQDERADQDEAAGPVAAYSFRRGVWRPSP